MQNKNNIYYCTEPYDWRVRGGGQMENHRIRRQLQEATRRHRLRLLQIFRAAQDEAQAQIPERHI